MKIEFNPDKSAKNVAQGRPAFEMVEGFDWDTALVWQDARHDYGEDRFSAIGRIDGKVYVVIFTPRGDALRIISFRRANDREEARYDQA